MSFNLKAFFNSLNKGLTSLRNYWIFLVGDVEKVAMQSRIYHSVALITTAVMVYNLVFCLIIGVYDQSVTTLFLLFLQGYLFYISRFKGKTVLSFTCYAIIIYLFFTVNYFFSGGLNGSTLLSFCIVYFLIIAVVPRSQYLVWTLVNIVLVGSLITWEFFHPVDAIATINTRSDRFLDIASTYVVTIILMFAGLSYIISNYRVERDKAERKSLVLHRMNDQKNKLISIISHDFNTPLSNIKRYLYILKNVELSESERKNFETDLSRVTMDTQNLLLNLLNWTKNNMESTDFAKEKVNILDAIKDTLEIYSNIATDKNIDLECAIGAEVSVLGNFEMIDVIIRNLINNAVKFTDEGGRIDLQAQTEGEFYVITVADNGTGIDEDKRKEIFKSNIFPTYGTKNERGVGLGLALCKELTDALNGEIWFSSKNGMGTKFHLKLPAVL